MQAERYKGAKKTQKLQSLFRKYKNTEIVNAKIENIKNVSVYVQNTHVYNEHEKIRWQKCNTTAIIGYIKLLG